MPTSLLRKAGALDVVEEIVMERNSTTTIINVAITFTKETALVMVVEIIITECPPLPIILAVEQTIIAVFIGSTTIEELTMIYPDMSTPIGLCTYLISLDSDTVRVAYL